MRKIKFRYWNSVSKIMVNDPPLPANKNLSLNDYFTDRGWVWMQFIGLLDKSGKEIYEGDIVKWRNEEKCEVFWSQSQGVWKIKGWSSDPLFIQIRSCEVIGNIYENKDLLK